MTTCTKNRRAILATESVQKAFVSFAEKGAQRGAWAGGYVLMPDHLHAFVGLDDRQIDLSGWMKSLENAISKALRFDRIAAPHWQKDFFDHVLRSQESYEQKWQYVRDNPERAGLVKRWQDWTFGGEIFDLGYYSR